MRKSSASAIIVALIFFAAVGSSALLTNLPPLVPVAYAVVSLVTFIAYAIDKSAARRGHWRISEKTLHLLALLGGWPGALVAQQTIRHKSKKASFRIVFWVTVLVNCGALAWLHTADGQSTFGRLLAWEQESAVQPGKASKDSIPSMSPTIFGNNST